MIKNINKIDFELKNLFDDVKITEESIKNKFIFRIICEKNNLKIKVDIDKKDLFNDNIKWSYYPDPSLEEIIERKSNLKLISSDIYDIYHNRRLSISYIKENYREKEEEIVEEIVVEEENFFQKSKSIVEEVSKNCCYIIEKTNDLFLMATKKLKNADKLIIESLLNKDDNIYNIKFLDDQFNTYIKVDYESFLIKNN